MNAERTKLEGLLATVLTKDQIQALREELVAGARRLHRIVDENERARARRDEILALMRRIDTFIEGREGNAFFLRTIYGAAKEQIKRLVVPMLEEVLRENEEESLDKVPATPAAEPQRAESARRRRRPRRRPAKKEGGAAAAHHGDTETD